MASGSHVDGTGSTSTIGRHVVMAAAHVDTSTHYQTADGRIHLLPPGCGPVRSLGRQRRPATPAPPRVQDRAAQATPAPPPPPCRRRVDGCGAADRAAHATAVPPPPPPTPAEGGGAADRAAHATPALTTPLLTTAGGGRAAHATPGVARPASATAGDGEGGGTPDRAAHATLAPRPPLPTTAGGGVAAICRLIASFRYARSSSSPFPRMVWLPFRSSVWVPKTHNGTTVMGLRVGLGPAWRARLCIQGHR